MAQLDEEEADDGKDPESDDPGGIEGIMEEFMVQLARTVIDEHFIQNCLLMKTARDKKQLNGKEGLAMMKGAWTPPTKTNAIKSPQKEDQEV